MINSILYAVPIKCFNIAPVFVVLFMSKQERRPVECPASDDLLL